MVLATGWDTVYAAAAAAGLPRPRLPRPGPRARVLRHLGRVALGGADLRAGLLRDLRQPLAARPARRALRRGAARWFRLGVDHGIYRPRPVERRRDTVIFYAREFTARRAVPLGRAGARGAARAGGRTRASCCSARPSELDLPFEYELLGVTSPEVLAWRYAEATVGLCLSLTNYSLIPQEMMACGLPCVDLAGGSTEAEFGRDGGVELADADPLAHRRPRSSGCSPTRSTGDAAPRPAWRSWRRPPGTWRRKQVEAGLREALRAAGYVGGDDAGSRRRPAPALWPLARLVRVALLCLLAFALLRGLLMGADDPPLLGAGRGLPLPLRHYLAHEHALPSPDKPLYPREYGLGTDAIIYDAYCCGANEGIFVGDPQRSIEETSGLPDSAREPRETGPRRGRGPSAALPLDGGGGGRRRRRRVDPHARDLGALRDRAVRRARGLRRLAARGAGLPRLAPAAAGGASWSPCSRWSPTWPGS